MKNFLNDYQDHVNERLALGIPPLALDEEQTKSLADLLKDPGQTDSEFLLNLLTNRINPGVDPAARIKAEFLLSIANNSIQSPIVSPQKAVELLGTMVGGYNLSCLLQIIETGDDALVKPAAAALKKMVLSLNCVEDMQKLRANGLPIAENILQSWAEAEWFTSLEDVPDVFTRVVYRVEGEINTDDFSPAAFAYTRADIPLHSTCMGGVLFPEGPQEIKSLKESQPHQITFVGDVVGTGSSRKSACNSLLWHIGDDIPFVPNKKKAGVILGGTIAPIFFNTAEDSGAFPIETDVSSLKTGDVIQVHPHKGQITDESGSVISKFQVKPSTLLDEYKAGGRVPLIIGKQLTEKARSVLGLSPLAETGIFIPSQETKTKPGQGFTLAQKMVGKACGVEGVLPGTACLPKMTTVGSQDTTGPMTANEMTELACLKFNADLVMQSFCHTAAYPKPSDLQTHNTLPAYISKRGGVSLRPGDGIIHSWLNRLLIPDTVGTGGDSHTRFPLGISFPAGSGLVAFAAALGVMPLDMAESVLVKFKGSLQPGVTLRDVVNMIPYQAIQEGKLTVPKKNKKNIFSGRILEMEGLPDLKLEQAFELTDAAAERSAAAATIKLSRETIVEYLSSNVTLMKTMIRDGYQDAETLEKRIHEVEEWIKNGQLMEADANAEYADVIEIDLDKMTEPILACPNDPDDVKLLSEVAGDKVDDVFIGSCMTNIGHFRAAAKVLDGKGKTSSLLWVCPPTKMDQRQLEEEKVIPVFAESGARIEMPGCSLCMGNQARVEDGHTVFSTSTRNFNNRMGKDARVYLGSSELAACIALLGKIPTKEEYMEIISKNLSEGTEEIYKYLNFHQMDNLSLS